MAWSGHTKPCCMTRLPSVPAICQQEQIFFARQCDELFPWVAANVYDKNNNLLFPPHIIKQLATMTTGIIGLTGNDGHSIAGCTIGDWRESLQKEITLLENRCDMLVVLSSLSESENREIQRDFNQIDIIVAADRKRANIQPQAVQNSLLIQSGDRGKYLGKLDITWNGRGNWLAGSPTTEKAWSRETTGKPLPCLFPPSQTSAIQGECRWDRAGNKKEHYCLQQYRSCCFTTRRSCRAARSAKKRYKGLYRLYSLPQKTN